MSDELALNRPDVVAQVADVADRYEAALVANDLAVLDELFWDSPHTVRFGAAESLYGIDAIREFRATRPAAGLARDVLRREITAFGDALAVVDQEHRRHGSDRVGRQSQTWVRFPQGWRVVSAHVSLL